MERLIGETKWGVAEILSDDQVTDGVTLLEQQSKAHKLGLLGD